MDTPDTNQTRRDLAKTTDELDLTAVASSSFRLRFFSRYRSTFGADQCSVHSAILINCFR
jgi:hypothetical protein